MGNKGVVILLLITGLAYGAYHVTFASGGSIEFETDWQAARETASLEDKPILLYFGGPW